MTSLPRRIIYATVREKVGPEQHEVGRSEHKDCCGSTPIGPVPSQLLTSSSADDAMSRPWCCSVMARFFFWMSCVVTYERISILPKKE